MILKFYFKVCIDRARIRSYKLGQAGFKLDIEKKNSFCDEDGEALE